MSKLSYALPVLGAALLAGAAAAHHSAAQFDFSNPVEVRGTISLIEVNNPHIHLVLEVSDDRGTREVEFEGHSRNNVYRRGWRPDLVGAGDAVVITIAPMRDGTDGGYVTGFRLEDGTEF